MLLAEHTAKNNPRLFRSKTLFVIMLRRQMLVKEVRVLRMKCSAWKNPYRTRDIDNCSQLFMFVFVRMPLRTTEKHDAWFRSRSVSLLHTLESRPVHDLSVSIQRCPKLMSQASVRIKKSTTKSWIFVFSSGVVIYFFISEALILATLTYIVITIHMQFGPPSETFLVLKFVSTMISNPT